MTAFRMGANRVWLLVTGGVTEHTTMIGPDTLILVELGVSLVYIHEWIIVYNSKA